MVAPCRATAPSNSTGRGALDGKSPIPAPSKPEVTHGSKRSWIGANTQGYIAGTRNSPRLLDQSPHDVIAGELESNSQGSWLQGATGRPISRLSSSRYWVGP